MYVIISAPPLAARELCTPEKTAHDVMDRLEIVANPSKKERMTSWTGRQFLQNPVSSLSPGFCVRILIPSGKKNLTIFTQHTTNTTITHHVQPRPFLFQQLMIRQPKFPPDDLHTPYNQHNNNP